MASFIFLVTLALFPFAPRVIEAASYLTNGNNNFDLPAVNENSVVTLNPFAVGMRLTATWPAGGPTYDLEVQASSTSNGNLINITNFSAFVIRFASSNFVDTKFLLQNVTWYGSFQFVVTLYGSSSEFRMINCVFNGEPTPLSSAVLQMPTIGTSDVGKIELRGNRFNATYTSGGTITLVSWNPGNRWSFDVVIEDNVFRLTAPSSSAAFVFYMFAGQILIRRFLVSKNEFYCSSPAQSVAFRYTEFGGMTGGGAQLLFFRNNFTLVASSGTGIAWALAGTGSSADEITHEVGVFDFTGNYVSLKHKSSATTVFGGSYFHITPLISIRSNTVHYIGDPLSSVFSITNNGDGMLWLADNNITGGGGWISFGNTFNSVMERCNRWNGELQNASLLSANWPTNRSHLGCGDCLTLYPAHECGFGAIGVASDGKGQCVCQCADPALSRPSTDYLVGQHCNASIISPLTFSPTEEPTPEPTVEPTPEPTPEPSTFQPTEAPTFEPTPEPTNITVVSEPLFVPNRTVPEEISRGTGAAATVTSLISVGVGVGVGIGGNPSFATHAGRAAFLNAMNFCPQPIDPDDLIEVALHPVGIPIGNANTRRWLGAVVCNAGILLSVILLQFIGAGAVAKGCPRGLSRSKNGHPYGDDNDDGMTAVERALGVVPPTPWGVGLQALRLPRADFLWWMFFCQSLVQGSLIILMHQSFDQEPLLEDGEDAITLSRNTTSTSASDNRVGEILPYSVAVLCLVVNSTLFFYLVVVTYSRHRFPAQYVPPVASESTFCHKFWMGNGDWAAKDALRLKSEAQLAKEARQQQRLEGHAAAITGADEVAEIDEMRQRLGRRIALMRDRHASLKALYNSYFPRGRLFFSAEIGFAFLFGVLGSVFPSTQQGCVVVAILVLVLSAIYLLLVLFIRPCNNYFDNTSLTVLAFTEFLTAMFHLIFIFGRDDRLWAHDGAEYCALLSMYIALVCLTKDIVLALVTFFRRKLLKTKEAEHEDEEEEEEDEEDYHGEGEEEYPADDLGEEDFRHPQNSPPPTEPTSLQKTKSRTVSMKQDVAPNVGNEYYYDDYDYCDVDEDGSPASSASSFKKKKSRTASMKASKPAAEDMLYAEDYEWDDEMGLYFSKSVNIFWDEVTDTYFHPGTGQWYDPDTDVWSKDVKGKAALALLAADAEAVKETDPLEVGMGNGGGAVADAAWIGTAEDYEWSADSDPYYYSRTEQLYFDEASGHYWCMVRQQWFDPESLQWYFCPEAPGPSDPVA